MSLQFAVHANATIVSIDSSVFFDSPQLWPLLWDADSPSALPNPPGPRRYITPDQHRRIIICKRKKREKKKTAVDPPQGALVPSRYRKTLRPLAGRWRINYGCWHLRIRANIKGDFWGLFSATEVTCIFMPGAAKAETERRWIDESGQPGGNIDKWADKCCLCKIMIAVREL